MCLCVGFDWDASFYAVADDPGTRAAQVYRKATKGNVQTMKTVVDTFAASPRTFLALLLDMGGGKPGQPRRTAGRALVEPYFAEVPPQRRVCVCLWGTPQH